MRYRGLDLNLLLALEVLLDLKNVTRAAERLNLSQSALSAALSRLRDFFGDDLLIQEGRKMYLTPFAQQISTQVQSCLQSADELMAISRSFKPETASRTFRIVASDYIISSILINIIRNLANIAPGIRLEIMLPDHLSESRLNSADIDLMISPGEYLQIDHPKVALFEEEYVVIGCKNNPLLQNGITEEDFWQSGHVSIRMGGNQIFTFADRYLQSMRRVRKIECIVPSFTMVPAIVSGTSRLAVLQKRLAQYMSQLNLINYTDAPLAIPVLCEMAQFHRSLSNDLGLQWLIGLMKREGELGRVVPRLKLSTENLKVE